MCRKEKRRMKKIVVMKEGRKITLELDENERVKNKNLDFIDNLSNGQNNNDNSFNEQNNNDTSSTLPYESTFVRIENESNNVKDNFLFSNQNNNDIFPSLTFPKEFSTFVNFFDNETDKVLGNNLFNKKVIVIIHQIDLLKSLYQGTEKNIYQNANHSEIFV